MIAHITGELAEKWDNCCIVLTSGGVGYLIALPAHVCLPGAGSDVSFFTSMAVREDAVELYGFETFEERQTFEILRAINKIGGRTALAILSVFRPYELRELVESGDAAPLTRVPGIGAKTAQHVFLELKYRLGPLGKAAPAGARKPDSPLARDLLAALANLGYSEEECSTVVNTVITREPDLDVASAIRLALKELAKGRS